MLGFNVFDPLEMVKPRKQTARLWKISHKSEKRIRNGINPSAMDRCGASALFGPKKQRCKVHECKWFLIVYKKDQLGAVYDL